MSIPTGDCGTLIGRGVNSGTGGRDRPGCRACNDTCGEVEGEAMAVRCLPFNGVDEMCDTDPMVPGLAAALCLWKEL